MGSGFKSRGVHHRNPVFVGHKPEGGVLLCPKFAPGHLCRELLHPRCGSIELLSAAKLHPAVPQLPDCTVKGRSGEGQGLELDGQSSG